MSAPDTILNKGGASDAPPDDLTDNDLNSMCVDETGLYKLIRGTMNVRAEMGLRHRASVSSTHGSFWARKEHR